MEEAVSRKDWSSLERDNATTKWSPHAHIFSPFLHALPLELANGVGKDGE
jgi:hypothetical protein